MVDGKPSNLEYVPMTFPLLPIGGAALAGLVSHTLNKLEPGEFLRHLLGSADASDTSRTTDSVQPPVSTKIDIAELLPDLAKNLKQRLSAAGVDLSQAITLKVDDYGEVVLDGEHIDRMHIEQLLAEDPQLRSDFLEVAAAATQEHKAQTAWVGSSLGEFRLHLTDQGAAIAFE